jgi:hypothetical protein
MLNGAGLEGELRDKNWAEYAMNDIYITNIIPKKLIFKCLFELLYGIRPTFHNNLKVFGEVGVIATK